MANFPLSMTLTDEAFEWYLGYCRKKGTNYKEDIREAEQKRIEELMKAEAEKKQKKQE